MVDTLLVVDNTASPRTQSVALECDGKGFGIVANSAGTAGNFTGDQIGVATRGGRPLAFTFGHGTVGPPADLSVTGQFAMDSLGDLFYCVSTGTSGVFRKLSGVTAAGSFHLLAQPVRVFDSRDGLAPTGTASGGAKGLIDNGSVRSIGCKANASGVTSDATAISFNLTIAQTAISGFLTAWGAGAQPASSSINWTTTGADIANGVTIACDVDAVIHVAAGGGGSTHFIVDVTGYYR